MGVLSICDNIPRSVYLSFKYILNEVGRWFVILNVYVCILTTNKHQSVTSVFHDEKKRWLRPYLGEETMHVHVVVDIFYVRVFASIFLLVVCSV